MAHGLLTLELHFARKPPPAWANVARRLADRPAHETPAETRLAYTALCSGLRACLPDASHGLWRWSLALAQPEAAYRALAERLARSPATPSEPGEPLAAWCALAFLVARPTPSSERLDVLTAVSGDARRHRRTFDQILAHLPKLDFSDVPGDGLFLRPRDLADGAATYREAATPPDEAPWPLDSP